MEWINLKDQTPPKDKPFLAITISGIEMMDWKERISEGKSRGWFGFYCPCSCCRGNCTDQFELWMPLPLPPQE